MALDRIHIRDLGTVGIVGIKPDERVTPQEILINATMWADLSAAAASDSIDDTVNYRTIAKAMIAHVRGGEPMLVERLAEELAQLVLGADPRVVEVELSVEKPQALRHARSVGVTLRRTRSQSPRA
jgi:dihydroneopterin aldolase/D-erythro-7,8-dihydroneopterin triphosphate epimerase